MSSNIFPIHLSSSGLPYEKAETSYIFLQYQRIVLLLTTVLSFSGLALGNIAFDIPMVGQTVEQDEDGFHYVRHSSVRAARGAIVEMLADEAGPAANQSAARQFATFGATQRGVAFLLYLQ